MKFEKSVNVNFPIIGLLGLAFVILKLCNVITWSWWWVLSPFWLPLAVVVVICLLALLFTTSSR